MGQAHVRLFMLCSGLSGWNRGEIEEGGPPLSANGSHLDNFKGTYGIPGYGYLWLYRLNPC